ncbi:tetratricopeptide repeat protein [Vibrio sonorensis]|uniref:tetratricopeptide repeat protein n=1 Tax=Vibrio sonorensis TaxID=1004316 RepID=UPI0008DA5EFC|nr:tetratricopeptide repeat protein [Vibrio sonorensis]
MLLNGQPFYGNKLLFDDDYTYEEQAFIGALNDEEALDYDSATTTYKTLLANAAKPQDIDKKVIYEYHLCRSLNRQGQYYQALVYCNALATHIQDLEDAVIPRYKALRVVANNQEMIGDYQAALTTYQALLASFPPYQDPSGIYNDAGLLLLRLGRIETAKDYLYTAINLRSKRSSPLLLAQVHHSLGEVLLEDNNYPAALRHFEATREITVEFNHHYGLTYA